jgi:hypothetical protein
MRNKSTDVALWVFQGSTPPGSLLKSWMPGNGHPLERKCLMSRTCEPASLAAQIIEAVVRLVGPVSDSGAWRVAAHREYERYTLGLYDFERQEVLLALTARLHGVL